MSRPRAILFDWDNTLIDSWPTIHAATNVVLAAMGHPTWSLEEAKVKVRQSLRDTFPRMFGDRWEEAREIYYKSYLALHLEELAPIAGVEPMLAALHAEGIYLGVVSNKNGDILRAEAAHLGWEKYFGALVGAGDAARDKPACDPVELALKPSGYPCGAEIWYVGDTNIDMECACVSSCVPVLLRASPEDEAEFAAHPPLHRFAKPADLLDFLGLQRAGAQSTL